MQGEIKQRLVLLMLGVILPFAALEIGLRQSLFSEVSYTNSINVDEQLKSIRTGGDWNVIFVGSSEVRWGVSPEHFDSSANSALGADASRIRSFNFGLDGFSPGLIYRVLERLPIRDYFPKARVLAVGVNLVEPNHLAEAGYQPGTCGALQKPVLTSALGRDTGLNDFCEAQSFSKQAFDALFAWASLYRHRESIRSLLLPGGTTDFIPMQSNGLPHLANGHQPHLSINDSRRNFESSWDRRVIEKQEFPERFLPLAEGAWNRTIEDNAFYDKWLELGDRLGVEVLFFAVPTSPMFYDLYDRREDYQANSIALQTWADQADVTFIDLGIPDHLDREHHYSDFRHLSEHGAPVFSSALGQAFGQSRQLSPLFSELSSSTN